MASLATDTVSGCVVIAEPSATSGGVCLVGPSRGISDDACSVDPDACLVDRCYNIVSDVSDDVFPVSDKSFVADSDVSDGIDIGDDSPSSPGDA